MYINTLFLLLLPPCPLKRCVYRAPNFCSVHRLSCRYQVLLETDAGQNDEVGEGLRCAGDCFDWTLVRSLLLADDSVHGVE